MFLDPFDKGCFENWFYLHWIERYDKMGGGGGWGKTRVLSQHFSRCFRLKLSQSEDIHKYQQEVELFRHNYVDC